MKVLFDPFSFKKKDDADAPGNRARFFRKENFQKKCGRGLNIPAKPAD